MEIVWLSISFSFGIIIGALIMYIFLRNRKIIAEFQKMHDDITSAHERLVTILTEWQKRIGSH